MMQSVSQLKFFRCTLTRSIHSGAAAVAAILVLTACGGGGGGGGAPLVPEAVVIEVAPAQALEDSRSMLFKVTLDKAVERGLSVTFSTSSTAKANIISTGSATEGIDCNVSGVDFIKASGKTVSIPAGTPADSFTLTVNVCPDAVFEPNETFNLSWTSPGAIGKTVPGIIINDDSGGLNSTGATNLLDGPVAFGRDFNITTKDNADGALGFAFNKSGTCTVDAVTGLTWSKTWTASQTFAQAAALAQASSDCGLSGWRVPTVNELLSLMDLQSIGVLNADALGSTAVADKMDGLFWTSEVAAAATNNAWMLSANSAGVSDFAKTTAANVRLVNGTSKLSACNNSSRYKDFGDGTLEDINTGLMWKTCAEGKTGATCSQTATVAFNTSIGTPSYIKNWLKGVNDLQNTSSLGYADWRIPTVKELASLVDRCVFTNTGLNVAIDGVFPNTQSISYISSSVDANVPNQYWFVGFGFGSIGVTADLTNKYLRLVRAGQ